MGMSVTDVLLKTVLQIGLDDLKANPYLVQDALSGLVSNPLLAKKYGQNEVDNAKNWIQNNKIEISFKYRNDKDNYPCISIEQLDAPMKADQQTLGDERPGSESVVLRPSDISKPIPFIINPFQPTGYDPTFGLVGVPDNVNLARLSPGMVLMDPSTGNAWEILDLMAEGIVIASNSKLTGTKLAVAPQFAYYKAKQKAIFSTESWRIGCHVHGDPSTLLWLNSFVKYIILRYRALLERNNMSEITFSNSPLSPDSNWGQPGAEVNFARFMTLNCLVEETWLDEPARILEAIGIDDGTRSGIKILSNLNPPPGEGTDQQLWTTTKDSIYSSES